MSTAFVPSVLYLRSTAATQIAEDFSSYTWQVSWGAVLRAPRMHKYRVVHRFLGATVQIDPADPNGLPPVTETGLFMQQGLATAAHNAQGPYDVLNTWYYSCGPQTGSNVYSASPTSDSTTLTVYSPSDGTTALTISHQAMDGVPHAFTDAAGDPMPFVHILEFHPMMEQ